MCGSSQRKQTVCQPGRRACPKQQQEQNNSNRYRSLLVQRFSAVSIRDITREAGIKESSLYNHFRSKEELQETIFYNFRLDVARIMPPVEMLDAILDAMTPEAFLNRGFQNFMEHIKDPNMEKKSGGSFIWSNGAIRWPGRFISMISSGRCLLLWRRCSPK